MNLTKFAKLTGYSLSTVSKAFHNSPEISQETRNRIFTLAKEHNCLERFYTPKYDKRVFALLCKEFNNSVYGTIVDQLTEVLSQRGDMILISINNFSSASLNKQLDYYTNFHKVDGLFIIDGRCSGNEFTKRIPTVIITPESNRSFHCDNVGIDLSSGFFEAALHLVQNGHRSIAYLGETLTSKKEQLFSSVMERLQIQIHPEWRITSNLRMAAAGFDGAERLLRLDCRPTAVFAAYDAIAIGAICRFHQEKLSIPKDISIVSCNDIPFSAYTAPPLSTVSLPVADLVEAAVGLMDHRLEHSNAPFQSVYIQSKFISRSSVFRLNEA